MSSQVQGGFQRKTCEDFTFRPFSFRFSAVRINRFALSELRERSGLSKSEFARALQVSPPHVTDIEAGRRHPSPSLTRRMAEVLKVPLAAILSNPENGEAA